MIRAIIFDCFGVLTTDQWRAFVDRLPEGVDLERTRELNHQYDSGVISRQDFFEQVGELTGKQPQEVESQIANQANKNTPLLDFISTLRPQYKIGLLSNIASNWIRDTFLTTEEQSLFDDMIFSHEVGMAKPDPEIFRLACERLGVAPEEAVMIDDIDRYCEAARAEGMQAIQYQNFRQVKQAIQETLTKRA